MTNKRYLIYVDILGFEELAVELGKRKKIEPRKIRRDFTDVINDKVETIKEAGRIIGFHYDEGDSWLLIADSLDQVFLSISELFNHNSGHEDYKKIPLEIAVGTGSFDTWSASHGRQVKAEDETIKFLKTYIIYHYHRWFKENGKPSPKASFILLTETAYQDLEPLDKKKCHIISFVYRDEVINIIVADIASFEERGKVLQFLEQITFADNKWYGRINEIYVPPIEYDEILHKFEKNRLLFITGTPEYGKTYTAVRLLWEKYICGYKPIWFTGTDLSDRKQAREKLGNIGTVLKKKHIIYFEDPFGRLTYESNDFLERTMEIIINNIKKVEDSYVVITSREEPFKEFKKNLIATGEIDDHEVTLNIKRPSYDYTRREQILRGWSEENECDWIKNDQTYKLVIDSIRTNERVLSTPLSMKSFAVTTAQKRPKQNLNHIINEHSEDSAKVFAKEIMNMSDDKLIFLLFPFVGYSEINFTSNIYQKILRDLNLINTENFNAILDWFKDDKVLITDKYIAYSHPSYYDALNYLFIENKYITLKKEIILNNVLLNYAEDRKASRALIRFIGKFFDNLSVDIQELFFTLSDNKYNGSALAWAVADNYNNLPEKARSLLFTKCKDERALETAIRAIAENFHSLPQKVTTMLFEYSNNETTANIVARAIVDNYNDLPEDVRNLLFHIFRNVKTYGHFVHAIASNYNNLPDEVRNILFILSEDIEAKSFVIKALRKNLEILPEDAQKLFSKLTPDIDLKPISLDMNLKPTSSPSSVFSGNYDSNPNPLEVISRDARKLMSMIKENKKNTWKGVTGVSRLVHAVAKNYLLLPGDVRLLFFRLLENRIAAKLLASPLAKYYYDLPDNVKNLIFKLSEDENTIGDVADAVIKYYDDLPENVRDLIFKFSTNVKTAEAVIVPILKNYNKLPTNVTRLIHELAANKNNSKSMIKAVLQNYYRIPENDKAALFAIFTSDNKVVSIFVSTLIDNITLMPDAEDIILSIILRSNLIAAEAMKAILKNYDALPDNIKNTMWILAENEETSLYAAKALSFLFPHLSDVLRNKLIVVLHNKRMASSVVCKIIINNFGALPKDITSLLTDIIDNDNEEAAMSIAQSLDSNFEKIEDSTRSILLTKLSESTKAAGLIGALIVNNFNNITPEDRNILINKISEYEGSFYPITRIICCHYKELPDSINELLYKFIHIEKGRRAIANCMDNKISFGLPVHVRNELLHKLCKYEEVAGKTSSATARHFAKLPVDTREAILIKLAQSAKAAVHLSTIIGRYFDSISETTRRQVLASIIANVSVMGSIALNLSKCWDKLPEDIRNTIIQHLTEDERAAWISLNAIKRKLS